MICEYKGKAPKCEKNAWVHKSAVVTGDVELGEDVSIWPCAVLRGDVEKIIVGKGSNIQDGSVLHTLDGIPCEIGENVTVGHNVNIHSAKIEDNCLIGIGAIILDGAQIGEGSIVAAGSLVPPRKVFPKNSLIMGSPAKVVREVTPRQVEDTKANSAHYVKCAREYAQTEKEI